MAPACDATSPNDHGPHRVLPKEFAQPRKYQRSQSKSPSTPPSARPMPPTHMPNSNHFVASSLTATPESAPTQYPITTPPNQCRQMSTCEMSLGISYPNHAFLACELSEPRQRGDRERSIPAPIDLLPCAFSSPEEPVLSALTSVMR